MSNLFTNISQVLNAQNICSSMNNILAFNMFQSQNQSLNQALTQYTMVHNYSLTVKEQTCKGIKFTTMPSRVFSFLQSFTGLSQEEIYTPQAPSQPH